MRDDPHLRRHLLPGEGIGGRIKERPDDFVVQEIPLYDPVGEGEHLYLGVRMENRPHHAAISALMRAFQVPRSAIGYAGMKDKVAVTMQTFSVHTPRDAPADARLAEGVEIVWADRHRNKLRRGHLRGNRFSIRVRGVDVARVTETLTRLRTLELNGFPNAFGPQRFGRLHNSHRLGLALIAGDAPRFLDELLGESEWVEPGPEADARRAYAEGRYRDALDAWPAARGAEISALRALAEGRSPRDAVHRVGRSQRDFWLNAAQSAIFNRVLDRRLEEHALATLRVGDVAWKHDSRSVFLVTEEERSPVLDDRAEALEISPSGPLWGPAMKRAEGTTAQVEEAALAEQGLTPEQLADSSVKVGGARRPLRERLLDPAVDAGADQHGPFIRLRFELPRGSYATSVLNEIMKPDVTALIGTS